MIQKASNHHYRYLQNGKDIRSHKYSFFGKCLITNYDMSEQKHKELRFSSRKKTKGCVGLERLGSCCIFIHRNCNMYMKSRKKVLDSKI